jgi:1,4-dihydroxy-2-naphthoyl-CoA hydrolase
VTTATRTPPSTLAEWAAFGAGCLPGTLGMEIVRVEADEIEMRMPTGDAVRAPNGFLHGGSVAALADTACGYGTIRNLPEGASGFTTIEFKCNFVGTATEGHVTCVARPVHRGRNTHVWDAQVTSAKGKVIAVFRCTQMILR